MSLSFKPLLRSLTGSLRDLLPVILVVVFFQLVVLHQPLPNLAQLLAGVALVVLGLTFFINGLEMALFPVGEALAQALARKGSVFWLLVFAFALGFGTTVAEPALMAVAAEAADVAAQAGAIAATDASRAAYASGLRLTVAFSVGFAIVLGVIRILKGWPMHWVIIGGYALVGVITAFAPREIIGIAYDSGGVTTSTITVPLVTALGVGLASSIRGRNPMIDGFGLIAFASLTPMIFVMAVRHGDTMTFWNDFLDTLLGTLRDVLPIAAIIVGVPGGLHSSSATEPAQDSGRVLLCADRPGPVPARAGGGVVSAGTPHGLAAHRSGVHLRRGRPPGGRGRVGGLRLGLRVRVRHRFLHHHCRAVADGGRHQGSPGVRRRDRRMGSRDRRGDRCGRRVSRLARIASSPASPIHYFIIPGYIVVVIQTLFAPRLIIPLAYDSGGVTTSTVTVPLVAALGLGLAETVPGRNALIDGFGLIAFASLFPIISVMGYAQLSAFRAHRHRTKSSEAGIAGARSCISS